MTTRENINLGTSANDGTGDSLRDAGGKINRNIGRIFNMLGPDSDTLSEKISFDSDTLNYAGSTNTSSLGFSDPSADRIIIFPDATGTVILDSASQTLTNKTLQVPNIVDSSSNEVIKFASEASAVNEITFSNGLNNPSIAATGDSSNITLDITGKGSGSVKLSKLAVDYEIMDSDGAVDTSVGYTIFNSASALAITMVDGTEIGETRKFTNRGAGTATVTPANFAPGTTFAMTQNAGCTTIWDGVNWYIVGGYNDSDITVA